MTGRRLQTIAAVAKANGVSIVTVCSWLERMSRQDRARCLVEVPGKAPRIDVGELDGWRAVRRDGGTKVIDVIEDAWEI